MANNSSSHRSSRSSYSTLQTEFGLAALQRQPGSLSRLTEAQIRALDAGTLSASTRAARPESNDVRGAATSHDEEAVRRVMAAVERQVGEGSGGRRGHKSKAEEIVNQSWVRGGVQNDDPATKEKSSRDDPSRIYKPTSSLVPPSSSSGGSRNNRHSEAREAHEAQQERRRLGKSSKKDRPKSELEKFKEELMARQAERAKKRDRHGDEVGYEGDSPDESSRRRGTSADVVAAASSSLSNLPSDLLSNNIYIANLSTKMDEKSLSHLFGQYGPLASVKIMWPRTDEERRKNRNCGFVAFMCRSDAERAFNALLNVSVLGSELGIGWGKPVAIPCAPAYIPLPMIDRLKPPPLSGLPFNAQMPQTDGKRRSDGEMSGDEQTMIEVRIPSDRPLTQRIHRTIEFVIREGPLFEAMLMNRELRNADYQFLFENTSPAHIYYRWKLFSILNGDTATQWRREPFHMFEGGPLWIPPDPVPYYCSGMPDDLIPREPVLPRADGSYRDSDLVSAHSNRQRKEKSRSSSDKPMALTTPFVATVLDEVDTVILTNIIENLGVDKRQVGYAMHWCIERASCHETITKRLCDAVCDVNQPVHRRVALLYLINDILHNCLRRPKFRAAIVSRLGEVMSSLGELVDSLVSNPRRRDMARQRINACCRVWADQHVVAEDEAMRLQNLFYGVETRVKVNVASNSIGENGKHQNDDSEQANSGHECDDIDGVEVDDVDGDPIEEGDVDGVPLEDGAASNLKIASSLVAGYSESDDDSETEAKEPQSNTVARESATTDSTNSGFFKPTTWSSVEVENERPVYLKEHLQQHPPQQSHEGPEMTSSKWDVDDDEEERMDVEMDDAGGERGGLMNDGSNEQDVLSTIEAKVLRYRHDVDSGRRIRQKGLTITEQVQQYRLNLLEEYRTSISNS